MTEKRLVITQGHQAVSSDPDVVLSTLLGSCVAVCLWDSGARLGGLNHILLAGQVQGAARVNREGTAAMERLIAAIVRQGGTRERLVAKVFGGAQMIGGLSRIGSLNVQFVVEFLAAENIQVLGQSVGGTTARQLLFWPTTGVARLKTVTASNEQEIARVMAPPDSRPETL